MTIQPTSSSADAAAMTADTTQGVGGQAAVAQMILDQTITTDTLDSLYDTSSISQSQQTPHGK